MKYYVRKAEVKPLDFPGHKAFPLLNESNGCAAGCKTGISLYMSDEYSAPGVHDDQEGFIVLEGTGWAKVGDEEFRLEPETSFIAPAGTAHAVRKDTGIEHVKLFWFHAAV